MASGGGTNIRPCRYVLAFSDNIYVEYAIVDKSDTLVQENFSPYESRSEQDINENEVIYYSIYSLLENKDDVIAIVGGFDESTIIPDYDQEVSENYIKSVLGTDWILRKCIGFDGYPPGSVSAYKVRIELPDPPGINFKYPDAPKFRDQVTPHVYFDTVKGDSILSPFSENTTVKAHTEYSVHVGEMDKFEANSYSGNSVFTVEISKTLFDKGTDDESTPDFPDSPIFDGPGGGKL